ncbi:CRISPR-associated nuclease/helicase Cas3 [Caloramator mitchellensis]|uniref:CRISPR-associated nuclease/helicase Cas3 n=1 Tax=Caloramator mitchellensis TaxID=908809 RepID=A0A0R3JR08_CALMK|nr:CRISPR-associated helicase/endonuclease Cas3 [Caloramator mitchellensis]KRQ85889.1 CRISPR-associated nuclease/helicase Cas3 [Caloramator mitchellensis]
MIYAKSNPVESLKSHTDYLLKNLTIFKNLYGEEVIRASDFNDIWELLSLSCFYHDLGKLFTPFQNEIRKKIGEPLLQTQFKNEVPHNFLSPSFIDIKALRQKYGENIYKSLAQAIIYHHEKDKDVDFKLIKNIVENDLKKNIENLESEFNNKFININTLYVNELKIENRIRESSNDYRIYVILKGLLNRLDHSASAHVDVEIQPSDSISNITKKYIQDKLKGNLREPQQFCLENRENNIIMIASTGIGKTESALLWIDNSKSFFTLPIRVSINAIYRRVFEDMQFKEAGLLHSSSFEFMKTQGYEDSFEKYEISRQLSYPLNFSTIDQLFTFPFKYRGYEKILATLAYSKVVIDEIQAYSPKIVAAILKGIEMINKFNGKFMIMTATLPNIFVEFLKKRNIEFEFTKFPLDITRHRMRLCEKSIDEDIDIIIEKARDKKVLIIVNTVKRAVEIFEKVRIKFSETNLLHSLFIQEDRLKKEDNIKNYNKPGIWISTQLVEASLDIDFDFLFTELSTLDSLFQRMGRCYRKREYDLGDEPNIFVYPKDASGIGTVYDKDIFIKGIEILKNYDLKLLKEEEKMQMVDELYSRKNLEGSDYLKEFDNAINFLDAVFDYDLEQKDAHKQLREMANVKVIPIEVYEKNILVFENYKKERDFNRKIELFLKIKQLTLDVPYYKVKNALMEVKYVRDIFLVKFKYDNIIGLHVGEEISNFI